MHLDLSYRGIAFGCVFSLWMAMIGSAAEPPLPFTVKLDVAHQELRKDFCWFHPRAAAIPGAGKGGKPSVIMTIQKHLVVSDYYSGMYFMRTDDLGATWTKPVEIPELAWTHEPDGVTVSVADVTPGWHAPTGKLIAIGIKVRYSPKGEQLLDKPRSHDCAYAVFDPKSNRWSRWKMIAMPHADGRFFLTNPGCVQWLVKPDGTVLLPIYFNSKTGADESTTVLHCKFDGATLSYLKHGDELTLAGGRGLCEPSLVRHRDKYYMTLRNDSRGYVTVSDDCLRWAKIKPWKFNDGKDLGSYNTQAHWLVHSDGLFLCYTRRGANNDHIARNRAPLFVAQVDAKELQVMRGTEKVLMPERGVMLGNFGASAITADESWVADAEFAFGDQPHPRGANGSVFVSRVKWSRPNATALSSAGVIRIVTLGDSITKGVRPGVAANESFAALLERQLRKDGFAAEVINAGIGGEQTTGALARLERDVIALRPAVVAIMYGTNDSYVYPNKTASSITEKEYETNLRRLVGRLREAGIAPVLMTEPRWGRTAGLNSLGQHPNVPLEKFMAGCRSVAKDEKVPLVDHFKVWSEHEAKGTDVGQWTTDQCHPNPTGHRVLADAMLPVIKGALRGR